MVTNKKEVGISALKTLFGAIPYVGTALDEVIFENRSRIKQDRLNLFSELLQEYFQEHGIKKEELENIKSEDFSDVFESVLLRVVVTKSHRKLERFRNILLGQMKAIEPDGFIETYLDLTTRLDDNQILILEKFATTKRRLDAIYENIKLLKIKITVAEEKINELKQKAEIGTIRPNESISRAHKELNNLVYERARLQSEQDKLEEIKTSHYYQLSEIDFEFYLQDLVSKSLLKDIHVTMYDSTTVVLKDITEFGMKYFDFLNQD